MVFKNYYITALLLSIIGFATISANSWKTSNRNLIEPRMYRGDRAFPGQFPYVASLRHIEDLSDDPKNAFHFCGSAIISERWIVSAAHCFMRKRLNETNVVVAVGAHSFRSSGTFYYIEKIIEHPNYYLTVSRKQFDISLIRTFDTISFHDHIQPIALSKNWIETADKVAIPGWGKTEVFTFLKKLYSFFDVFSKQTYIFRKENGHTFYYTLS